MCCTSTVWERNRGIAIKDGYVVRGTSDGYLVAMNAQTGALVWARRVARADAGETFTMAPMIFEDLVLIGPAGSENNIQGWVSDFRLRDGSPVDARTGREVYRFNTGGPIGGGVVTYAAHGRQYIAVASGSPSSFRVDANPGAPTVVIFALARQNP